MRDPKVVERLAKGLTVLTFILLCWVGHRALEVRTHCLNSSYLSVVQLDGRRIYNCVYESRLNLSNLLQPVTFAQSRVLRALEQIDQLSEILPAARPKVVIEVLNGDDAHHFELTRHSLRLGEAWLSDAIQLKRALIMAALSSNDSTEFASHFQLEVVTDFLLAAVYREDRWTSSEGDFSFSRDVRFPTTTPEFADYCRSPFRSLAHYESCQQPEPDSFDLHGHVWGVRPLLASALYRVFMRQPLPVKIRALETLRTSMAWPRLAGLREVDVQSLSQWFEATLADHLATLGLSGAGSNPTVVKQVLKELQVESPTHWELTVDLTNAPAWREIVEQLRTRSRFHEDERVLVFTPEGKRVFPSGLLVAWSPTDIQSQKHVLVACQWPKPEEAVAIRARHMYASQACGKLTEVFW